MFGFLFGIACCVGIYWIWRGGGPHAGRGFKRRFMERAVYERLDATPGQERVIAEALDSLEQGLHEVRTELGRSLYELSRALREDSFDERAFDEVFARQDGVLGAFRKQVTAALAQVHGALDRSQRMRLAELIELGPGRRHHRWHRRWA